MTTPRVHLDLIGLVVADMGKALAFYRRLGLELPASADAEGRWSAVIPALTSGARLDYYFEAQTADGTVSAPEVDPAAVPFCQTP